MVSRGYGCLANLETIELYILLGIIFSNSGTVSVGTGPGSSISTTFAGPSAAQRREKEFEKAQRSSTVAGSNE